MDRDMTERLIAMMASENDTDAVMGLRGLQGLLRADGIDFKQAMTAMLAHAATMTKQAPAPVVEANATPSGPATAPAQVPATTPPPSVPAAGNGMPQCSASGNDIMLATPAGQREVIALPSMAAEHATTIAACLTNAMVAAVINKSRMKLKLVDTKNNKGEVVETILRAEYDRDGMMPVQIWINARGEVAALAAVLRKGLANAVPDLMAA